MLIVHILSTGPWDYMATKEANEESAIRAGLFKITSLITLILYAVGPDILTSIIVGLLVQIVFTSIRVFEAFKNDGTTRNEP